MPELISDDEYKDLVREFESEIKMVLTYSTDTGDKSLIRSDLVEGNDFSKYRRQLENILDLHREITYLDLSKLHTDKLIPMMGAAQNAVKLFERIIKLRSNQSNLGAQRLEIIRGIEKLHQDTFDSMSPIISYLKTISSAVVDFEARMQTYFQDKDEELNSRVKTVEDAYLLKLEEVEELQTKTEKINENAMVLSKKAGASYHAKNFEEIANNHRDKAKTWLKVTVTLGVFMLLLAFAALTYLITRVNDTPSNLAIQISIAKALVFSILFFATLSSARIYRAHLHNEVANRHRQNALASFEAFVGGAEDEATKNAVLLECTRSIFSQQQTGFINQDADGGSPSAYPEIIKLITTPGK